MNEPASLPQGCEWLAYPHRFRYAGNSGLLCECALSVAVKRGKDAQELYVLCSELKQNWGTTVTNSWGPAITLELQAQRHILTGAGEKLDHPGEPALGGWHYHVSEEEVAGWHFFEHHGAHAGDAAAYVAPVTIPFEEDDVLLGPRLDLAGEHPGALLSAMTREVANRGFDVKEVPW
ncbi:MAG: hypothetical protein L0I62_04810 [Gammaproteobacteria bacterium]|nr:hypothetical protein [Gammaproteobacteria bacterium]